MDKFLALIMKKLFSALVLPVLVCCQLFLSATGETCPENTDTITKLLSSAANSNHRKLCPDFKDDGDQSFCCPSSITPGTFYCCTEAKKEEIDAELSAEARRLFFRNNLSLIIVGSILAFVVTIILVSFICKRVKMCPLYQGKSVSTQSTQIMSRYRPVDTIPPKPPAVYEAPPPYDYSVAGTRYDQRREHDWNCLIDNEVNDNRAVESDH